MQLLLPLFFSSILVSAAPHRRTITKTVVATAYEYVQAPPTLPTPAAPADKGQIVNLQNKQAATPSSYDTELARMSTAQVDAIYKTCWNGQLQWPLPNTPNPCVDVEGPQLSLFPSPASSANTLTVHNYCGYDIYFDHYNGANLLENGKLSAGSNIARPLSGTVLKASKSSDMSQVVLIEYAVASNVLYYDLSMITCLGSTNGLPNSDTSGCAGHEAGLQLGNANAKSFQCGPGVWCDDQAYLYQENLCKKQNPVTSCTPDHGLTMEFCASMKS